MKSLLPLFLLSYTLLNAEQSQATHSIIEEPDKLIFNFQYRGRFDIYDGVNKLAYGDDAIDAKGNVRGEEVEIAAWIDGAMPFRAETISGYLSGYTMVIYCSVLKKH
jgi:hypothetical protein